MPSQVRYFLLLFLFSAFNTSAQDWKVYYDSTYLYWEKEWPKTIELLEKAKKNALLDLGIYDPNYTTILNDLGIAYSHNKEYNKAEQALNDAVKIKKALFEPSDPEYIQSLNVLATFHLEAGDYAPAKSLYLEIINSSSKEEGLVNFYAGALKNLSLLYELTENLDSASYYLKKIPDNFFESNNDLYYHLMVADARLKRKEGFFTSALEKLDPLIKDLSLRYNKDPEEYGILLAEALDESGLSFKESGLLHRAEKELLKAYDLRLNASTQVKTAISKSLNNLADLYQQMGFYSRALTFMLEAWELCNDSGTRISNCISIKSNLASIYLKQDRIERAISLYKEVVDFYQESSGTYSSSAYLIATNNLATAYRKNRELKLAEPLLIHALEIAKTNTFINPSTQAILLNNMGILKLKLQQMNEAESFFIKSIELRKRIYGEESVMLKNPANDLAILYLTQNRVNEALKYFKIAMNMELKLIKHIFPNLTEEEKAQFYNTLKYDFERFNSVVVDYAPDNPELLREMFNKQLLVKGLLFNSANRLKQKAEQSGDSILNAQYKLLAQQREVLGHYYQMPEKKLSELNISIADLEKQVQDLEKEIALKTSNSTIDEQENKNPTWSALQKKLAPDEALVEIIRFRKYDSDANSEVIKELEGVNYGFTDSVYYAALISTHETLQAPTLILIKEGKNLESRFLNFYKNAVSYDVTDSNSYNFFWKPFAHLLKNKKKIYFSNDGVFHKMNLNMLWDPEEREYLISQYDIRLLINPGNLLSETSGRYNASTALLVGDPDFGEKKPVQQPVYRDYREFNRLPQTRSEVLTIEKLLKKKNWKTKTLLDKEASEQNIKTMAAPEVLHIATHGFFADDIIKINHEVRNLPLFQSGLVLSNANKARENIDPISENDGFLTAYEVMNLDLSETELVVLSACETALGQIENGEGVYGLQRAFLAAGAKNLVISLWKIEDEATKELMINFYEHLLNGTDKYEALKKAQIQQMEKRSNTKSWGAFIIISN